MVRAVGRLERGLDRRKERHHRDAEFQALLGDAQQSIQGPAVHARHGGDGDRAILALHDEYRIQEVVHR
jgi:hypothetical protein